MKNRLFAVFAVLLVAPRIGRRCGPDLSEKPTSRCSVHRRRSRCSRKPIRLDYKKKGQTFYFVLRGLRLANLPKTPDKLRHPKPTGNSLQTKTVQTNRCPISGAAIDRRPKIKVDGNEVAFSAAPTAKASRKRQTEGSFGIGLRRKKAFAKALEQEGRQGGLRKIRRITPSLSRKRLIPTHGWVAVVEAKIRKTGDVGTEASEAGSIPDSRF